MGEGQSGRRGAYGGTGQDTLVATDVIDLKAGKMGKITFHQKVEFTGNVSGFEVYSMTGLLPHDTLGSYKFWGDSQDNTVYFSAGRLEAYGGGGNDIIASLEEQLSASVVLYSGATIQGGNGNDTLLGGGGRDRISGGRDDDFITGAYSKDTLAGGSGNDTIDGGRGHDFIEGGRGNDVLIGDNGFDTLDGGSGDDHLTGGRGADEFRFKKSSGNDTITDFDADVDMINISGITNLAEIGFAQSGNSVILSYGESTILVENQTMESLLVAEIFGF